MIKFLIVTVVSVQKNIWYFKQEYTLTREIIPGDPSSACSIPFTAHN